MEAGVGMFGTKCGMRTLFMEDGTALPCTIIGFESENMVAQIKTEDSDGYNSVQVMFTVYLCKKLLLSCCTDIVLQRSLLFFVMMMTINLSRTSISSVIQYMI